MRDVFREERPVRQPGEGVVVGLVAQLLLERRELVERLLHLPVLEQDRRLTGVRLQQARILVRERRVGVRDGDHCDRPRRAAEPGEQRGAELPLGEERRQPWRRRHQHPAGSQRCAHGRVLTGAQRSGSKLRDSPLGAFGHQRRIGLLARQQHDPGEVGPEQVPRRDEQLGQARTHARLALREPHRGVEGSQVVVAAALVDIRPEDEAGEDERRNQEQGSSIALAEQLDPSEREGDARRRSGDRREHKSRPHGVTRRR